MVGVPGHRQAIVPHLLLRMVNHRVYQHLVAVVLGRRRGLQLVGRGRSTWLLPRPDLSARRMAVWSVCGVGKGLLLAVVVFLLPSVLAVAVLARVAGVAAVVVGRPAPRPGLTGRGPPMVHTIQFTSRDICNQY